MARDLYRVFARIGVRGTEEGDEHFIEHGTIGADEMPEDGGACLALGERCALYGAKVLIGDADGFGSADADDADGSTLGGGYSADGVVGVHVLFVLSCKDSESHANYLFPWVVFCDSVSNKHRQ